MKVMSRCDLPGARNKLNTQEILEELQRKNIRWEMGTDPRRGFSSHLIRCRNFEGIQCFFVGSELSLETKLNSVVDALYILQNDDENRTSFEFGLMYGGYPGQELLMQILSNLNQLFGDNVELQIFIDFENVTLPAPSNFESSAQSLETKLALIDNNRTRPPIIDELLKIFDDRALQWSPTSLNENWIGRIDGLQFCTIRDNGEATLFLDENPRAKRIMLEHLAQSGFDIDSNNHTLEVNDLKMLITILREAEATSRLQECVSPQRVRSRIMSKKAKLIAGEAICEDLPCLWSNDPAYETTADLIFSDADRAYAVHFEISTGGRIENNFRYGILKAALNAQFIRSAQAIHPWLESQGITPESCQPVLAFPKLTSARARSRFPQLTALAEVFGVNIVQVRGSSL